MKIKKVLPRYENWFFCISYHMVPNCKSSFVMTENTSISLKLHLIHLTFWIIELSYREVYFQKMYFLKFGVKNSYFVRNQKVSNFHRKIEFFISFKSSWLQLLNGNNIFKFQWKLKRFYLGTKSGFFYSSYHLYQKAKIVF